MPIPLLATDAVRTKSDRVNTQASAPATPRFVTMLAATPEEIRASQRLRHQVFAEEMGADLPSAHNGLDHDRFDAYCQHLLVRDAQSGQLVGSTRLLSREAAEQAGGFYSETEFEMAAIKALPGRLFELGRTCVHADFRSGAVIGSLWQGLAAYILSHEVDHLIGCASIEWGSDGSMIHAVTRKMQQRFLVDEPLRVKPKVRVPNPDRDGKVSAIKIPPLMKAYVSLGARVCGEPCWDAAFGVADLFMLLNTKELSARYARHFLDRQRT